MLKILEKFLRKNVIYYFGKKGISFAKDYLKFKPDNILMTHIYINMVIAF